MLTVVRNSENSKTILIPADEMEKLGIDDGVEVEMSKENDQIILRPSSETERKRKFEKAKNEIFEEWHDVFVELAKGADDETAKKPKTSGSFVLIENENGKYKFQLQGVSSVLLETDEFSSANEARQAIDSIKKQLSEIQGEIIDFPVID